MATVAPICRSVKCVVVTPERAVLDVTADAVTLPMYDGELGVLPGRAPLIGRLGSGELRLQQGPRTLLYVVDGGFGQVQAYGVTRLTPRAMKVEGIDRDAAAKTKEEALKPDAGEAAQAAALKAQERARAQLRLAGRGSETSQA